MDEVGLRNYLARAVVKLAPSHAEWAQRSRLLNPDWHRARVGGAWDAMGDLQFKFLVDQGLEPGSHLLDVGCGSLRGGVRFVQYLDPGHYCGMDRSPELLDAGKRELARAGLSEKQALLLADENFAFSRFDRSFDFALAQSVFTHLPFNTILRCLGEMERVLRPGGRFFVTYFRSPGPRLRVEPMPRPGHKPVYCDRDPFYYDPDLFRWAVEGSTLSVQELGDWGHPRQQQMLVFVKSSASSVDHGSV